MRRKTGITRTLLVLALLLVPVLLQGLTTEKELFSQAESRYLSGNYRSAYESYDRFVRSYPLSPLVPDAQFRKAVCLFRMDRYGESVRLFDIVERKYPATSHYDMLPFWKGVALYRAGDSTAARESLVMFLRGGRGASAAAEALHYLALAEVDLQRYQDAGRTLDRLIAVRGVEGLSGYEKVLYGYVLLQTGDYGRLVAFFERVDPSSLPQQWRERGMLYAAEGLYRSGELERAQEYYAGLLDADPETAATAYRRLYTIAQREGDLQEMERLLNRAEERLIGRPLLLEEFWLRMGMESHHRGELELAAHFLRKVAERRGPGDSPPPVPLYLSEIAASRGDYQEAVGILQAYLRERDEGGRDVPGLVLFQLGDLHLRRGEYRRAADRFGEFLETGPDPAMTHRAHYSAAFAEHRLGNQEPALEHLDRALATEGPNRADALRLKARVLIELNRLREAERVMDGLVSEQPGSVPLRMDRLKLYVSAGRYQAAVSQADALLADPALEQGSPDRLQARYVKGLSLVSLKRYQEALEILSGITRPETRAAGLEEVHPSALYYRAWSAYRLRRFEEALDQARSFLRDYDGHPLAGDAAFLAGWCSYSLGRYGEAAELFARVARDESRGEDPGALADKAFFLQAKSEKNRGMSGRAAELFASLYTGRPDSPYADYALLEHAHLLREEGGTDRAVRHYLMIRERYPQSPVADEALYFRGETLFAAGGYGPAEQAFMLYRESFPGESLVDAALYWEGAAALRQDGRERALALWRRVIDEHPDSSFRPGAMYESAEVNITLQRYQDAASLYDRLIDQYPEFAAGVGASLRHREISYLAQGLDRREAELTALISDRGGADTEEGRRAMIELARLYIFERHEMERAFQLLTRVMRHPDPSTIQEAGILLGEYYYRTGEIERAGRTFINAAVAQPGNRDLMAHGLFRAAQMMKLSGREKELRELVERLERNFPGSEWSNNAVKLLEGLEERR